MIYRNKLFIVIVIPVLALTLMILSCGNDKVSNSDPMSLAAIEDLTVDLTTNGAIHLSWTAPGNNEYLGAVKTYDIRFIKKHYHSDLENWSSLQINRNPSWAGQHEGILISNLDQGPKYYFKVRAIDTQGNFSEWSNLVSDFAVNDFIINVPDTGFESTVRLNTHKSEGDLFYKDMLNVEALSKGPFVVTNISGMEYMKNLNRIYFLHTGISDLTPLSDLEVLNSIIIVHAQINDLNPIGKLTNMAELNLAENQITDISPIRNFTNLLILNLSENQLSDISILSDFKKLSRLQLDSNNIVDFSPISELTDLSQLDLQNNEIDDISFIEDLSSLRRLYLGSNNIKDISVLSKLNGIRYLYLKNNNITDILPLVHNENFGEGDEIDLSNNPLSEQSINEYIPALEARGVTVVY